MKGVSAKGRKKPNQMLKRVQHDKMMWFWFLSSRTWFGISVWVLNHLGSKAPTCGRGSLLGHIVFQDEI
jgi:hypothetical protein